MHVAALQDHSTGLTGLPHLALLRQSSERLGRLPSATQLGSGRASMLRQIGAQCSACGQCSLVASEARRAGRLPLPLVWGLGQETTLVTSSSRCLWTLSDHIPGSDTGTRLASRGRLPAYASPTLQLCFVAPALCFGLGLTLTPGSPRKDAQQAVLSEVSAPVQSGHLWWSFFGCLSMPCPTDQGLLTYHPLRTGLTFPRAAAGPRW